MSEEQKNQSSPVPETSEQKLTRLKTELNLLTQEVSSLKKRVAQSSPAELETAKQSLSSEKSRHEKLLNLLSLLWLDLLDPSSGQSEFDRKSAETFRDAVTTYFTQIKLDPAQWKNLESF